MHKNLEICQSCTNRKTDWKSGIICGLTNKKPIFVGECKDFVKDEVLAKKQKIEIKRNWGKDNRALPVRRLIVLEKSELSQIRSIGERLPKDMRPCKQYASVHDLPATVNIKASQFIFEIISSTLGLVAFTIMALNAFNSESKLSYLVWLLPFMALGLLVKFGVGAYQGYKSQKVYLKLTNKGISFDGESEIQWEEIKTFRFFSGWLSKRLSDYLEISLKDDSFLIYDIKGLSISKNKLGCLLNLFLKRSQNDTQTFGVLTPLRNKGWSNFNLGRKIVDDTLIIRNKDMSWMAYLLMIFVFMFECYLVYTLFTLELTTNSLILTIILMIFQPLLIRIPIKEMLNVSADQEPKISLTRNGIGFYNNDLIPWEVIREIGFANKGEGRDRMQYLVAYCCDGKTQYIGLRNLSLSPVKIENAVLHFKSLE